MVASVSEPSDDARDSIDHAMPHFYQSCCRIRVGPPLADHGISYIEMMSMLNDIDITRREVELSFLVCLICVTMSIPKLNSKNLELYSFS